MPEVPRLSAPSVTPDALPGVRVTPTQPALGPDLSGPFASATQLIQEEQRKADQVRVNDADNQMTVARDRILYGDPNDPATSGLLAKRGQNAFGGAQQAIDQWNQAKDQIGASLNDRQKLAFQNRLIGYEHDFHLEVQSHVLKERQRYDAETTDGYVDNRLKEVAQNFANEKAADRSLQLAVAAKKDYAARNGVPPDATEADVAKLTSTARLNVLQQLLTAPEAQGGGDLRASAYLNAHRTELNPSDLAEADRLTMAGSVRGESQRQSDAIMQGVTTLKDGLAKAAAIQDPRVREATEERVRRAFTDQAASDRDARNAAFVRSSKVILQGGELDDIPLEDKTQLSPTEYDQLVTTRNRIRNPVVETSPSYYTHWVNMAGLSDASRQEFLNHDFGQDRTNGKLSESDFHYFAHLQLELRARDDRQAAADDARAQRGTDQLRRREETTVLKAAETARKSAAMRAGLDSSVSKYLPPVRAVTPPGWMLDSARTDSSYAEYLKLHGVDVDALTATPAPSAQAPARPKPKAPGAPIQQ